MFGLPSARKAQRICAKEIRSTPIMESCPRAEHPTWVLLTSYRHHSDEQRTPAHNQSQRTRSSSPCEPNAHFGRQNEFSLHSPMDRSKQWMVKNSTYHWRTTPCKPFGVNTPRSVPFAYHDKHRAKLTILLTKGTIEPVTEPTEWCAPIIVSPKKVSFWRLCVVTVNSRLIISYYYLFPPSYVGLCNHMTVVYILCSVSISGVFFFWTQFQLSLWMTTHLRMRLATPSVYLDLWEGGVDRAKWVPGMLWLQKELFLSGDFKQQGT